MSVSSTSRRPDHLPDIKVLNSASLYSYALTEIHLGENLEYVNDYVFGEDETVPPCRLYFSGTTPPVLLGAHCLDTRSTTLNSGDNVYYYEMPDNISLLVPAATLASYAGATSWRMYTSVLTTY